VFKKNGAYYSNFCLGPLIKRKGPRWLNELGRWI